MWGGHLLRSLYLDIFAQDVSFQKWAIPGLFFFIFVVSIQLTVNKCSINFADHWIRTADLWYWKQPLYQLSHNHCPKNCLTLVMNGTLKRLFVLIPITAQ